MIIFILINYTVYFSIKINNYQGWKSEISDRVGSELYIFFEKFSPKLSEISDRIGIH